MKHLFKYKPEIVATTPTPHICKKSAPKRCRKRKGKYGIRALLDNARLTEMLTCKPKYCMPTDTLCPFAGLLDVVVVSKLLKRASVCKDPRTHSSPVFWPFHNKTTTDMKEGLKAQTTRLCHLVCAIQMRHNLGDTKQRKHWRVGEAPCHLPRECYSDNWDRLRSGVGCPKTNPVALSLSLTHPLSLSLSLYIYIYIYICRTAGCGTTFFQKTGRFRVHLRAGSGPTRVSHYKNRDFRGTVWRPRKRPKTHKLHTPWGKRSVL